MIGRRLAAVAVVVLAVTACGGESEEESVSRAIATNLRSEDAFAGDISNEEARCVGDAIVADLGVDDARTLGGDDQDDDTADDPGGDEGDDASFALSSKSAKELTAIGDAMESCVADLESLVVERVAGGILEAPDDDFPIADAEAQCVGKAVAAEIPFSRLLIAGVETEDGNDLGDLDDEEAAVVGAAFSDCVDVRSLLLEQVAANGAAEDVVACLDEQISDEAIEQLFVDTFAGETTTAENAFASAIDACT